MLLLYQRLERCREVGGLSFANIALWLDVNENTVKEWAVNKRYPQRFNLDEIYKRLADLELAIEQAGGRLIPPSVRQRDRKEYLRGVINARGRAVHIPGST